jgi:RNA polymerase sigma-70 factor (ECF subfamily)
MNDVNLAALRQLLVERYDDLRRRLARRLGSAEFATEVLHETYLRLGRGAADFGMVRSPKAYSYRTALNVAADHHRRAGTRRLSHPEIEALRGLAEAALDPVKAMPRTPAEDWSSVKAIHPARMPSFRDPIRAIRWSAR